MRKLPVVNFGTDVQGFQLYGDPKRQLEPAEVRIAFPGGDISACRTSDGSYWAHVRINTETDAIANDEAERGYLTDARLDIDGKATSEVDVGDFRNGQLYHVAIRIGTAPAAPDPATPYHTAPNVI